MTKNETILNGRYTLTQRVTMPGIEPSELWEATDREGEPHTLKITPYIGEKPPPEIRRLWDNDLRVMYRLSSSAGANGQIVVMTDAGIDARQHVMVLVYEGQQNVTFSEMLSERDKTDWLAFKKLKERSVRRELWRAFLQLAKGLKSLHDQNLIHRNVTTDAIWGRLREGSDSLRLGGFDWSARIGHASNISERNPWATPPELKEVGYSFASDWYGFGTTIARCFHKVEHLRAQNSELAGTLASAISAENPCNLTPLERDFLKVITAPDRLDRLQRSAEILQRIESIIEVLDFAQGGGDSRRVLIQIRHTDPLTIEAARAAGFLVNPDDPFESFDATSDVHHVRLMDFLTEQLRHATLSWKQNEQEFELRCVGLFVKGQKWMDFGESKAQSWGAAKAYLSNVSKLREPVPSNGFEKVSIDVEFNANKVSQKIANGLGYIPWSTFSPQAKNSNVLGVDSENLRQFLHASNQFEILLRDAELYKCKVIPEQTTRLDAGTQITIAAASEDRASRNFFNANRTLINFFSQEWESGKQDCNKVLLTDSDSLFFARNGTGARFDVDNEQWTISDIDQENETITLFRPHSAAETMTPPAEGYLRTRGHYGQIRLIERRKQSIDRLSSHAFLLRTLATPESTRIDAGESELPWSQLAHEARGKKVIDENKLATIKDILRMRPMYALQGPPGTGKSTLVAHLLRQILEDDPMAQILVTAKDHTAVDVLRDKVVSQAYKDTSEHERPLAIRLNRRDGEDHAAECTRDMMRHALNAIQTPPSPSTYEEIQQAWLTLLQQWSRGNQGKESPSDPIQKLSNSIVDLVRRSASITYCTTSAGDLEELAKGARSFDWSIVEEAGKTHGFDLALPLQAGHRWLLLGDHKQLRPFLYDEFVKCFNSLGDQEKVGDGVINILTKIGEKSGNNRIVDIEWLKAKLEADAHWAKSFPIYARAWLASFARVFEQQRRSGVTENESIGASAGLLTRQYRMPPAIGDLNSSVFYKGAVANATSDAEGNPNEDHCHPFTQPTWLAGKSLVWVEMPWTEEHKEHRKTGYSNKAEQEVIRQLLKKMRVDTNAQSPTAEHLTVAVLTPYNLQKNEINGQKEITAPAGSQFGSAQNREPGRVVKAYSVDSFQGDEADIIVLSLVRNKPTRAQNTLNASDIQFIAQPDRLNVMLSRPTRLLIIVGCWEYMTQCMAKVSSTTNAQGEYNDPEYGPFKKTLEQLESMFKDGRALRIALSEALQ